MDNILEQFKKDQYGLYIYASNYNEVLKSFEPYEKIKELIDKKKRSRKRNLTN